MCSQENVLCILCTLKLAALQVKEGEGKFAQLPTAVYGTKDDFHKGLEV